jgi:predicted aspartyl protease
MIRFFANIDNRAALERLLERGRAEPGVISRIVNGTPLIRVEVWRGNAGPYVVVTLLEPSTINSGGPQVTNAAPPSTSSSEQQAGTTSSVPMLSDGGVYVVPVLINGAITLDFVVDSGAADVSIPADVVMTLMRTGTLKESDFLGQNMYVLADGSKVPSQTFRIRSLRVGDRVLENVNGSVASVQGSLLLGQSFLSRFNSWSVDNTKHALVLE